jgi:uncharacterized protein (DUF58 family)
LSEKSLSLTERFRLTRFFRGEAPVNHSLTLNHRRIFILPTQRGLGFVVLIVVLLLIAFVYNNNLAYLLGFLLASIFFITILHSYRSLAGLIIQPGASKAAFAGEAAGFTFHISNPARHQRHHLRLTLQSDQVISLVENQQKNLLLYVDAKQRGWLACPTFTLSSTYPLGLFRAWSPLRFQCEALVYPRPATIERPFPESQGVDGEQGQGRKGGDDFYGIKTYQPGDSIRQIHWKAFAKGQGLYRKEYGGTAVSELWLNLEQTPGHTIEERLCQLCRWIIDAEHSGIAYGLNISGHKIVPGRGNAHYRHCLETLALF